MGRPSSPGTPAEITAVSRARELRHLRMTKLFLYSADAERAPLIVVRSVDRIKTVGLFAVTNERASDRAFDAVPIRTRGADPVLRAEKMAHTFCAVVPDAALGRGTATFGARRVRFEQVGHHAPTELFERIAARAETTLVPAREPE